MGIKSYKIGLLWMCIILSMACVSLLQAEPECKTAPNPVEAAKETPPPDPYADAQIMVEAFVVEVSTEGLKALGVSPLGQTPDGISIAKLTECLMQGDNAKVFSGAKVVTKQEGESNSREEKRIYLKEIQKNSAGGPEGPREIRNVTFKEYQTVKEFKSHTTIVSENTISISYAFGERGVLTSPEHYDPNDGAPPTNYNYCWSGQISLQPGKPQIAAAVQNTDDIVFLVLTATIQKDTPIENQTAEEKKEKSK